MAMSLPHWCRERVQNTFDFVVPPGLRKQTKRLWTKNISGYVTPRRFERKGFLAEATHGAMRKRISHGVSKSQ